MTPAQWKNREHEQPTPPQGAEWATPLVLWLQDHSYLSVESGPYNPDTGRGQYSHPCEYQRGYVRVRVNHGGIIILRDPGCTIQITRPAGHGMTEFVSPNMLRIDYPCSSALGDTVSVMQKAVTRFENHPAFAVDEARSHFFDESEVSNA